nr:hypothetical protein [Tanacetum cinerariifolium]
MMFAAKSFQIFETRFFIPLNNSCDDAAKVEIIAHEKDNGDKKNWLSSTHFWNTNDNLEIVEEKEEMRAVFIPEIKKSSQQQAFREAKKWNRLESEIVSDNIICTSSDVVEKGKDETVSDNKISNESSVVEKRKNNVVSVSSDSNVAEVEKEQIKLDEIKKRIDHKLKLAREEVALVSVTHKEFIKNRRKVVEELGVAMKLSKLFRLAYDVHMCRMIPQ